MVWREEMPAVGEGVGGDIDDTHDPGFGAQFKAMRAAGDSGGLSGSVQRISPCILYVSIQAGCNESLLNTRFEEAFRSGSVKMGSIELIRLEIIRPEFIREPEQP